MIDTYLLRRRALLSFGAATCASLLLPRIALGDVELTPEAFQKLVIDLGAHHYPGRAICAGRTTLEVLWGDHHLYLGNAFAIARMLSSDRRDAFVLDFIGHFSPEADARIEAIKASARDWDKAQPLLRPKLFPMATIRSAPWLVSRPMTANLVVGYAIDLGTSDLYVSNEWLSKWNRLALEVDAVAISNLEAMSTKMGMSDSVSDDGVVVIATGDGYDAARLLLPGLRVRLLEALGAHAMAAAPARDLLVAWSARNSGKQELEQRVRDISLRAPHALSDDIFVVERGGARLAMTSEL